MTNILNQVNYKQSKSPYDVIDVMLPGEVFDFDLQFKDGIRNRANWLRMKPGRIYRYRTYKISSTKIRFECLENYEISRK